MMFFWILSLILTLISIYLIAFYVKVYSYPKGPFPLPIIGNLLVFRDKNLNEVEIVADLHKLYGPVYTIWIGRRPKIMIGDFEIAKKAFNSKGNELMGRPDLLFRRALTLDSGCDIMFTSHCPAWVTLRKVTSSAVRNLAINENFGQLVNSAVEVMVQQIKQNESINTPFDVSGYLEKTLFNIGASSAAGNQKLFAFNDPELIFYEEKFAYFRKSASTLAKVDNVPFLLPLYNQLKLSLCKTLQDIATRVRGKYIERVQTHRNGDSLDICDALIMAKQEAIENDKQFAPHLNDTNLSLVIMNLFMGFVESTKFQLYWIILFMANNIDFQKRMRKEINDVIGNRVATHEDIKNCNFINAFIAETLRMKPAMPIGVPHKAFVDFDLDNYKIPKNCVVIVNLFEISRDKNYFVDPDQFNPNRFLTEEGIFTSKVRGFCPFGIGKRSCLADKLALAELFFITVRLLKSTENYMIELPDGDSTAKIDTDPNFYFFNKPTAYKILLKSK